MPCRDDYPQEAETINGCTINELAAIACAALRFIDINNQLNNFLASPSLKDSSGMAPKEISRFFELHKEMDAVHRAREAKEAARKKQREAVTERLTPPSARSSI